MKAFTRALAIVLLVVAAMFNAYYQILYGFSYLQTASIVLMLVAIVLLLLEKHV